MKNKPTFNEYIAMSKAKTEVVNRLCHKNPNKAIDLACESADCLLKASKIMVEKAVKRNDNEI